MIQLHPYQIDAVEKMHNGCILVGGMGTGKSRTALAYYYICQGGDLRSKKYTEMRSDLQDLYIITPAQKRNKFEWELEMPQFLLSKDPETAFYKNHKVIVDSWNNIKKYEGVKGAFFIFDEQKVGGYGTWAKTFIKIARSNDWILLSATPGDCWSDYIPVFIANGFFRNKSEFDRDHVIYDPNTPFPKIDRYLYTGRLIRLRNRILVQMRGKTPAVRHDEEVICDYDLIKYKEFCRDRWNFYKDKPIENASEYCQCLRRLVNSDPSREVRLLEVLEKHPTAIIFYNYDFELEILRNLGENNGFEVAEWNGHKHQEIPDSEKWVYLVQYNAGSEGWNCLRTDTIIFYSQNYSYKTMIQASGRVDRMNSPFKDLYFYYFKSNSKIDLAISRALRTKKNFNEGKFVATFR